MDDQITLKKMEELKKNNEFKLNGEQMSILRSMILYQKVYRKMKQKMS